MNMNSKWNSKGKQSDHKWAIVVVLTLLTLGLQRLDIHKFQKIREENNLIY